MKQNKMLKVLSTAALAAAIVAPVAAPVSAASTYTVTNVQSVATNTLTSARIAVEIPSGSLGAINTTSTIRLRLPVDAAGEFTDATNVLPGSVNALTPASIPPVVTGTDGNAVQGVTLTPVGNPETNVGGLTADKLYREWDVTVTSSGTPFKGLFYLDLKNIYVPSSASGTLPIELEAAPGSALSSGKIDVATVGTGVVTVTADNIQSITTGSSKPIGDIRIKEDRAGALKAGKAVKIKLPKGFKWSTTPTANFVWGDNAVVVAANANMSVNTAEDSRTLTVNIPAGVASNAPTYFSLTGGKVDIDDTEAVAGPVEVTLSGDSSLANSTAVVANYGDYGSSFAVADAATVNAGVDDQKIGKMTFQETAPGSFAKDRTIKLTLSGKAKWNPASLPQVDTGLSDMQGLQFVNNEAAIVGTDGKTVQWTVSTATTGKKGAKIVLSTNKGTIDVAADAGDQDITVAVAGSAGVTGQGTVAKAIAPVDLTADQTKDLRIGVQDQELGDLVLQEKAAGALDNKAGTGRELTLKFPSGTAVSYPSSVTVTEGDISLDLSSMSKNGNVLTIPVKSTSTKASKIKISGLKLNVDRTVSEGPLKVEVAGGSLIKTAAQFPGSTYVVKPVIANVVTAAPTDTTAQNIVFKLNSKTFTVNGKEQTMDAAPLVAWDRAFLPVRFAANALNVSDDNIIWDDKTSTATIFKGDRVIVAKVGDKFLTVNGAKVPMDVPVYRSAATNNRVMIPVRYLSNALGANIQWNQETSEITIGVK